MSEIWLSTHYVVNLTFNQSFYFCKMTQNLSYNFFFSKLLFQLTSTYEIVLQDRNIGLYVICYGIYRHTHNRFHCLVFCNFTDTCRRVNVEQTGQAPFFIPQGQQKPGSIKRIGVIGDLPGLGHVIGVSLRKGTWPLM